MALEIRPAQPADVPAMAAIYGAAVRTMTVTFETEPPGVAEMTRRFEAREAAGHPCLVAVGDGAVVGYAETRPYHHRPGYRFTAEDSIFLEPAAHGRGTGTALLRELVAQAEARGFRQLIAVIGDSANAASIRLHRKAGFELVGTTRAVGLKFGRWIDVVIMQRALGEGSSSLPPDA
jgi:L-amino acid N-acyltransferase YncA